MHKVRGGFLGKMTIVPNMEKCYNKEGKGGEKMAISKKQQACVNRYQAKHYDLIRFNVAKGGKEIIKAAADMHGESMNAYIIGAIRDALGRDGKKLPDRPSDAEEAEETEE